MNANELRIGNMVDFYGQFLSVTSIDSDKIATKDGFTLRTAIRLSDDSAPWLNHVNEIQLDEEWLTTKLGFHQRYTSDPQEEGASQCFYIGDFILHNTKDDDYSGFYFYAYEGLSLKVETVHHLQNLFFDLERKDLCVTQP